MRNLSLIKQNRDLSASQSTDLVYRLVDRFEMTLSFIPKLIITIVTLMLAGPWMLRLIMDYAQQLIQDIPYLVG